MIILLTNLLVTDKKIVAGTRYTPIVITVSIAKSVECCPTPTLTRESESEKHKQQAVRCDMR
ncbi:hypothetical protein J6590_043829 [Homalodisca vitripennis]|nr:hypothetical protein J6590_043829 [Homalodisca vitripennis]